MKQLLAEHLPGTIVYHEYSEHAYLIANTSGVIRATSPAAARLLGIDASSLVGIVTLNELLSRSVPPTTPWQQVTSIDDESSPRPWRHVKAQPNKTNLYAKETALVDHQGRSHGTFVELSSTTYPNYDIGVRQPSQRQPEVDHFDAQGNASSLTLNIAESETRHLRSNISRESPPHHLPLASNGSVMMPHEMPTALSYRQGVSTRGVYEISMEDVGPCVIESHSFAIALMDHTKGVVTLVRELQPSIDPPMEITGDELRVMRTANARLEAMVHRSGEVFLICDPKGSLLYAHGAFSTLVGASHKGFIGRSLGRFISESERPRVARLFANFIASNRATTTFSTQLVPDRQILRHVEVTLTNLLGDPAIGGILATIRDITDKIEIAQSLAYQGTHDSLTGLPNHRFLIDRMTFLSLEQSPSHEGYALILLDIDGFKRVNDSIGHQSGDDLLRDVGERLRKAIGEDGIVARLSGDEFGVLLPKLDTPDLVVKTAERLRSAVKGIFRLGMIEIVVDASVGVAISRGEPAEDTLKHAGTALHAVKDSGGGRTKLFTSDLNAALSRRLDMERTLRRAIEFNLVIPYYQPVVTIPGGKLYSHEALVRIEDTSGALHAPAEFIDVAEETGLIMSLGQRVLEKSIHQLALWKKAGAMQPRLSVNLSPKQLHQKNIVEVVEGLLQTHDVHPPSLCLELTENAFINSDSSTYETLARLNRLGVRLAIDDFGTGWSSLTYLRTIPASIVKIDQSFTFGLGVSRRDTELVRGVISLCKALGLTTVAEGVETQEQLDILAELGCDLAQGYLFGRPAPPVLALESSETGALPHEFAAHDRN